jgi:predicted NUDIX family phosphoesterase
MSGRAAELVYAVPRDLLFDGVEPWLGVRRHGVGGILQRVNDSGRFVPRGPAETDPTIKQIIPYLVLRDGDRVFLMRRTRAGGEARLHDHYTIGIGGHLNPGDGTPLGGLLREWNEEIAADFVPDLEFFGLLNDDTVDVGRHHFGLVYVADAAGRPAAIRERDKLSGSFEPVAVLRVAYDGMETWSRLVLDALVDPDPPPIPASHLPGSKRLR